MTLKDHMQLTAAEQIEQWRTRRKLLRALRLQKRGVVKSRRNGKTRDLSTKEMAELSHGISRLREQLP